MVSVKVSSLYIERYFLQEEILYMVTKFFECYFMCLCNFSMSNKDFTKLLTQKKKKINKINSAKS